MLTNSSLTHCGEFSDIEDGRGSDRRGGSVLLMDEVCNVVVVCGADIIVTVDTGPSPGLVPNPGPGLSPDVVISVVVVIGVVVGGVGVVVVAVVRGMASPSSDNSNKMSK
jgi:hypothetical protein